MPPKSLLSIIIIIITTIQSLKLECCKLSWSDDSLGSGHLCLFVCLQSLKVECCKLRARIVEVQQQNDELRHLFCDAVRNQLSGDDILAISNLQVSSVTRSMTVCVCYGSLLSWNRLPATIRSSDTPRYFKNQLKAHFF